MNQHNPKNELLKYKFLEMLTHAKGRDPKTVQAHANAIYEFEVFTGFKDFKKFEVRQAIEYKEYLAGKMNSRTGGSISKSYLQHYTAHVKAFFEWLCNQKGYSNIKYDEVQYFNLSSEL
jgi:site-specific recombinase XerD